MQDDELLATATEVAGMKVLPPCAILAPVGMGGMGAVYRGRHLNLDIDVAVKVMTPELVHADPQFVARFRREGQSAAKICHQNVIRVYDVAEDHDLHYLTMEFVQGETARRIPLHGPFAWVLTLRKGSERAGPRGDIATWTSYRTQLRSEPTLRRSLSLRHAGAC